jgi:hypothetical protein
MKGEGVGRTSIHDATDPHPALRAGLSLPGRGVSLLLRGEQAAAFCPLTPPSKPLSNEHRSTPGAPVVGAVREPPLQHAETRVVHRNLHPTGRQCRGDPVGRPVGVWWAGTPG